MPTKASPLCTPIRVWPNRMPFVFCSALNFWPKRSIARAYFLFLKEFAPSSYNASAVALAVGCSLDQGREGREIAEHPAISQADNRTAEKPLRVIERVRSPRMLMESASAAQKLPSYIQPGGMESSLISPGSIPRGSPSTPSLVRGFDNDRNSS